MKTMMLPATLATALAGAYCHSACGQEFTFHGEWTGFADVATRRELPSDCKLDSHLAITRTSVTDDTRDTTDEIDQWADDQWVVRDVAHWHYEVSSRFGSNTWLLDGTPWHESTPKRVAGARADLELLRQLTEGMWNWTFGQRRRGRLGLDRCYCGFAIADSEPMTFGGSGFLR